MCEPAHQRHSTEKSMTPPLLRPATAADVPAMMALVRELALYEKAPEEVTNTEECMLSEGFGPHPLFRAWVAEAADARLIGLLIFYTAYSTWKGKIIYLDDLIISEPYRKSGVGRMMFEQLLRLAKAEDAAQLRWHVLHWNEPALQFYKKFNAALDPEWTTGKLSRAQIQALV